MGDRVDGGQKRKRRRRSDHCGHRHLSEYTLIKDEYKLSTNSEFILLPKLYLQNNENRTWLRWIEGLPKICNFFIFACIRACVSVCDCSSVNLSVSERVCGGWGQILRTYSCPFSNHPRVRKEC